MVTRKNKNVRMKTVFTQTEINNYLKEIPDTKHLFYKESVSKAKSMAVHANGEFPSDLISERRPHEPAEVLAYREKIWIPKTKPIFSKVFSELQKIRRSADWSINYDLKNFTRVAPEDSLESYCEKNYPYFGSVTNWVFTLLLRKYLIDSNAVVFVRPKVWNIAENSYLEPDAEVFDSHDVIDFIPEDYAVLNDPTGSTYYVKSRQYSGRALLIITRKDIIRYKQVDNKGTFDLDYQIEHQLPELPVFPVKGILVDQAGGQYLYESRISGIIPELDEAVREYSDLQAAKVLHIYPERWEYTQTECPTCKGSGKMINPDWSENSGTSIDIPCRHSGCRNGYVVNHGPYSKIYVKPPANGMEGAIPTPPAGYVEKDVEIVKVQNEGVEQHIYNALSSINFEFLAKVPLAESGEAKKTDMDALNNTVHSIAEDIVAVMDSLYKFIAYYRYQALYRFEEIDLMCPKIPVPEKFDILASSKTMEELSSAKNNKSNPVIISALEVDYSAKRFNTDHKVRDAVSLSLKLDPLPNITEDDKMSRLTNKGITQETYIISSNIQEFIQRAITDDERFPDKSIVEQKEVLKKYAQEIIGATAPIVIDIPEIIGE